MIPPCGGSNPPAPAKSASSAYSVLKNYDGIGSICQNEVSLAFAFGQRSILKLPGHNRYDHVNIAQRPEFADMVVDQFEEMLEGSDKQPLVFALSLHGFIGGQPFRLRPLRQAIKHCVEHKSKERVWFTRAGEIAKYCFSLKPGITPGS